jgi:glycosyltransferase involved in cell wall biosynthesis
MCKVELSMIVKNEGPVIARCLASVRPFIDYWVIVDTGSTDGTQDAIRAFMGDLPGVARGNQAEKRATIRMRMAPGVG